MKKIAITGGICSGKSTASGWLESQGYPVIDTDKMAHQLYEEDEAVKKDILEQFGTLDRRQIRVQAFEDPQKRKILESILHPRIGTKLEKLLNVHKKSRDPIVFVVVPLLFEAGWQDRFDEVWTLSTPPEKQFERIKERGLEPSLIKRILQSQFSNEDREEMADRVLLNETTRESLYDQLKNAISDL